MSNRASIFEKLPLDIDGFTPSKSGQERPGIEQLNELTQGSKFRSREGVERVEQRRRRTGRNVQFNIRATQQVINEFKTLSERMDWPDGLTLQKALGALKRELGEG